MSGNKTVTALFQIPTNEAMRSRGTSFTLYQIQCEMPWQNPTNFTNVLSVYNQNTIKLHVVYTSAAVQIVDLVC